MLLFRNVFGRRPHWQLRAPRHAFPPSFAPLLRVACSTSCLALAHYLLLAAARPAAAAGLSLGDEAAMQALNLLALALHRCSSGTSGGDCSPEEAARLAVALRGGSLAAYEVPGGGGSAWLAATVRSRLAPMTEPRLHLTPGKQRPWHNTFFERMGP